MREEARRLRPRARRPARPKSGRAERREPQIAPPREQHDRGDRRRQASPAGAPRRCDDVTGARHGVAARRTQAAASPIPTPLDTAEREPGGAGVTEGRAPRARAARAGQLRERARPRASPALRRRRPARGGAACAPAAMPALGDDGAGGNRGERCRRERDARRSSAGKRTCEPDAERRPERRHDDDRAGEPRERA